MRLENNNISFESYSIMGEVNAKKDDFWTAETLANVNLYIFKLDSVSKMTVIEEKYMWLKGEKLQKQVANLRHLEAS